jgi:5-methylcytosine-specific restriction endonuclease McrA
MAFNMTAYRTPYMKEYRAGHLEETRQLDRDRYARVRKQALTLLGGICLGCGESELEFMTIDHVHDDGAVERSTKHHRQIFADIVAGRVSLDRYRPLCRNCNDSRFITSQHATSNPQKDRDRETKFELFTLMGGFCSCPPCGIRNHLKLSVDHINNDGASRRASEGTGARFYGKILRGELSLTDFQLLCFNCNYSKHLGHGFCVHERKGCRNGL